MDFSFDLSNDSLAMIALLTGKSSKIKDVNTAGMKILGKKIAESIPDYMEWKNPSGKLEGSFSFRGNEVGSDLPYARRREFGFSGKTDSRGRLYTEDPGGFYMEKTLGNLSEDEVTQGFVDQLKLLFG